jgi:hypothetical protein
MTSNLDEVSSIFCEQVRLNAERSCTGSILRRHLIQRCAVSSADNGGNHPFANPKMWIDGTSRSVSVEEDRFRLEFFVRAMELVLVLSL